jgi:transcriptional regulator with XRE-family HTH domain
MHPPDWPGESERRSETRRHLLFATTARGRDGESQPVLVRDISARGLLLETEEGATLDQTVTVTLPEAGDVEAHVIWHGDKLAGCRLDHHLSQATIDAVRDSGEAAHAARGEESEDGGAPIPRSAARTLAARLKQLRIERDLTRAELAERSGISTPSIWAWETGRTVPRLGSLETLAKGLGVSVSELQIGAGTAQPDMPALGVGVGDGGSDLRTARLMELVAASKAQIAALAGTTPDRITITIAL